MSKAGLKFLAAVLTTGIVVVPFLGLDDLPRGLQQQIDAERRTYAAARGEIQRARAEVESGIRADFDFTGEGMTWEREMQLDLEQNGTVLVRREFGDDALPEPLRYTKCG